MNKIIFHTQDALRQSLPIHLHSISDHYQETTVRQPHGYPFHQILMVLQGEGILECRGQEFPLKHGCAFYTAPGVPMIYRSTDSLTTAFLTVTGPGADQIPEHFGCDGFLFRKNADIEKLLPGISAVIEEYYSQQREGILSALSYSFYIRFFEPQKQQPSLCRQVALYIEKYYAKKLSLSTIAQAHSISVSKLCHDFKKEFGCSVFSYILNLRLTYARNLLHTNPDTKTKDVALLCGFEDSSYFCKAYKARFGVIPSEDKGQ